MRLEQGEFGAWVGGLRFRGELEEVRLQSTFGLG